MAKSKPPRKKYVQKYGKVNPLEFVLSGMRRLSGSPLTKLQIINHGALAAMVSGKATKEDWELVCTALNVSEVLCAQGLGTEYRSSVREAMQAHAASGRRYLKVGKFGYSGPELNAVNIAMDVHDAQLEAATVMTMENAYTEVGARYRRGEFDYTVKNTKDKDGYANTKQADVRDLEHNRTS